MPLSRFALAAIVALFAGPAVAASAWTIDKTGGVSASVANASGNMVLTLGCATPNLALTLSGHGVDVDLKGTFSLGIDGKDFPLTLGKARNALLLTNMGKTLGIDPMLTDALKTGKTAVLSGTAFAKVAPADTSFALKGSGAAVKAVAASCGAPTAPATPAQ
jgi:hypothetical protein